MDGGRTRHDEPRSRVIRQPRFRTRPPRRLGKVRLLRRHDDEPHTGRIRVRIVVGPDMRGNATVQHLYLPKGGTVGALEDPDHHVVDAPIRHSRILPYHPYTQDGPAAPTGLPGSHCRSAPNLIGMDGSATVRVGEPRRASPGGPSLALLR